MIFLLTWQLQQLNKLLRHGVFTVGIRFVTTISWP